jgi:hypothetical protein
VIWHDVTITDAKTNGLHDQRVTKANKGNELNPLLGREDRNPHAFHRATIQSPLHRRIRVEPYSTEYTYDRMALPGLMSTVPHELRKLYYNLVVCGDLDAEGTLGKASSSTTSSTIDRTNLVYKDELRIPKVLSQVMTFEEQRIATGDAPGEVWTPMMSLGNKKDLDRTRENYLLLDAHVSIRILHLLPAKSRLDDIECELQVVRLVDEPVYEALSYTWGDESHRRYINVNGQRFSVTSNLWSALRYLRHTSNTRCLWVDAICINQQNITERSFMVSQMHVIYHNSKRVIAWLGDPTLQSEQAFRFLAEYMSEGPQMGEDQEGWKDVVENSKPMRNVDLSTWEALLDVFGRPWWGRAWIIQEVSCSRAGWSLMCGSSELNGNHLSCILSHFFDALEASEVPPEAKTILDSGPFGVLRMTMGDQDELGSVLVANRSRKAKDDKDKVYAFVNLVYPEITELRPNYQESTAEIYYQTAVQLIVKCNDLRVLSICENQSKEEFDRLTRIDGIPRKFVPGLPTWVPSWAEARISSELWGGYVTDGVAFPFKAAGGNGQEVKFHGSSLVGSKGLLTIRAKKIATVEHLGQDIYGELVSDAVRDAFRLVANAPIIVPKGQNGADGVFRSLTLDRDAEGERTYDDIAGEPAEITRSIHRAVTGRRFFRTKEGFVGLGPLRLKAGDMVMLVPGCHVPLTLRPGVFIKEKRKVKCDAHTELEICLGLDCAKDKIVPTKRYEVIGETCE